MKAKHIEEDGEDLIITFPSAKNDQFHAGHTAVLAANGSDFCPVKLADWAASAEARVGGANLPADGGGAASLN